MSNFFAFLSDPQRSKLFRLILLAIVLVALPLIVIVAQQQQETRQRASEAPATPPIPPGQVALALSPASSSAYIGESLSVDLVLTAGTFNITGVDIIMNFNEAILPVNSFTPGTQFNSELIKRIDHNVGSFRYVATNTNPSVEITGEVKLGTFTLTPKVFGQGQLNFLSTQITAYGETNAIPATTTGGTYIVTTKPTLEPTASPTAIPTNTPVPPTATTIPTATPTNAPLQGDANGDGSIDILDYNIWRDEFIAINALGGGFRSDFNRDGKVDLLDFNIWRNAFK